MRRTLVRLTVVASALTVAAACTGDAPASSTPAPSRVDAVVAPPPPEKDPKAVAAFCDSHFTDADAKPFVWPGLADSAAVPANGEWRWVNVWATWCKPCVAEMPLIVKWQGKLAADGLKNGFSLLSVDDNAGKVTHFGAEHPDLPVGLRIDDVKNLETWLTSNGLDASVAIPLNFFLDGQGRTRCVRSGQISDTDYAAIKRVLQGE